jgi:hypothetical protein
METTTTWPRLPEPPDRGAGEDSETYGARLAIWVLQTGQTATLSDDQADRAHRALELALTRRAIIGYGDQAESTPTSVYDALEDCRRLLRRCLDARKPADLDVPDVPACSVPAPDLDGGSKVPRVPIMPVRPPAGRAIRIDF